MKQCLNLIFIWIFSVFIGSSALGERFESSVNRVQLLELYSSEGCSSCPPADKWLATLREDKNLWKTFVPIEFHVDYWNRLGWVDPFSKEEFTSRQSRYAKEWGVRRIYTPGFVLSGKEWRSKTKGQLSLGAEKPGKLIVERVSPGLYNVSFRPEQPVSELVVSGALLGNGLETKVPAGENAGATLRHEFVVLDLQRMKMVETKKGKATVFSTQIRIKNKPKVVPKSLSVAFWVSHNGSQVPIQAVGGDLEGR